MAERDRFEVRLEEAMNRYLDRAPMDMDPRTIVLRVAASRPRIGTLGRAATRAAAVALILALGVAILWSRPTGPDVASEASTAPQPSPSATPPLLPRSAQPLAPGTWRLGDPTTPGSPMERITATVPDGWAGIRDGGIANLVQIADLDDRARSGSVVFWLPDNAFIDPCDTSAGLLDPPLGPTVDDFVAAMADVPGFRFSAPTDVTLLGYRGMYLEEEGPADTSTCTDGFAHPWQTRFNASAQYVTDGQRDRLWVLDVDGQRLVIDLEGETARPRPTGTDPVSWDEQQQVFDSIHIAPAPSPAASPPAASPPESSQP